MRIDYTRTNKSGREIKGVKLCELSTISEALQELHHNLDYRLQVRMISELEEKA